MLPICEKLFNKHTDVLTSKLTFYYFQKAAQKLCQMQYSTFAANLKYSFWYYKEYGAQKAIADFFFEKKKM